MKNWLKKYLNHKDIGWREYGEDFVRYQLLKTRWFNLYLHRLDAPNEHPCCHDHPWWFITLLIWPGYLELVNGKLHRRWPGFVLYRKAEHLHMVTTPYGTSWSLVLTGSKSRDWGFKPCEE